MVSQQPKGFYLQQYMRQKKEQNQPKTNMSIEEQADACIIETHPQQNVILNKQEPMKIKVEEPAAPQECANTKTQPEEEKTEMKPKEKTKVKKVKRQWKPEYVLTWFSDLQNIQGKVVTKYKYCIQIKYQEKKGEKEKQITLKIGNKNCKYRVDGATEEEARLVNMRLQKYQTPFDKGYWVIQYLNRHPNKYQARAEFMEFIQNKS